MTLGVSLCVMSMLGSSVISTIPFVFSLAGEAGKFPDWSLGSYTIVMNFFFVFCQILILQNKFEPLQLFQLVIGFFFGWLIDLNMWILEGVDNTSFMSQIILQCVGCTVMGIGIAFEVRCGSVTMPGEGITIALSEVTKRPFPKLKIIVDTSLVVLAVMFSYIFFNKWMWNVVGFGTLFAMIYVGLIVKFVSRYIGWFDKVLAYPPGFRRYIFGLLSKIKGGR